MDIVDVQFPLARQPSGPRQLLKRGLGRLLLPLMPQRRAELQRGAVGERLGRLDRLLLAALVAQHERAGTLDELGALHDWIWASKQALRFHEQAQSRFDDWWRAHHSAILEPLQAEIAAHPAHWATLCEIGCGSGLVLADLSRRLPSLQQLIGLDLSPAQIERNREAYAANPRLRFEAADGACWLAEHAQAGWLIFSNAGVLEYFPPEKLSALLRQLAQRAPVVIASVEPIADDYDLARETASRIYGPERSWSHHYPRLYRESGFTPLWQRELHVGGLRWLLVLARAA